MARAPAASLVLPRIVAADRAIVLLGICGSELVGRRLSVEGRGAQVVRCGRFGLLVSPVTADTFGDVPERVRDDPARLAHEGRILERAVERARAHGAVVPTRVLTVFASWQALEAIARAQA
ncbi:MAG: GvpL/GvpF family gas vesicle protein, partial [Candidatus Dormibacteria bacterium]